MLYNTKITITKNRVRVIKTNKKLEVGYERKVNRYNYEKASEGDKSDYSFKRALDNLVLTIDSNVTYYSKFITLTFANTILDYKQAMRKFNIFTYNFKRKFGQKLLYTRISERQRERGKEENNDGSWHFHLIVYINKKLDFKLLKSCWPWGSVDLKKVDNNKNLARYFGKYFSKQKSDIALNNNLVSHSQGLKRPSVIYDIDNFVFDNYKLLYNKEYTYRDKGLTFKLSEYDISDM